MTCREFHNAAASLTLADVTRALDTRLLQHADACPGCGAWLQKQHLLATSMGALRAQTAELEAGPNVQQALLQALRRQTAGLAAETFRPTHPAFSLSRVFGAGAYAAIAAALILCGFLAVQLLQRHSVTGTAEQAAPTAKSSFVQQEANTLPSAISVATAAGRRQASVPGAVRGLSRGVSSTEEEAEPEDTRLQTASSNDYVALMLCDPLTCPGDTQTVRMELTRSAGAGDAQPQIADVVVGYDGVVRAVRIVN